MLTLDLYYEKYWGMVGRCMKCVIYNGIIGAFSATGITHQEVNGPINSSTDFQSAFLSTYDQY